MLLQRLLSVSQSARARAYCPYSNFPVGVALLANSGAIYSGCNVENCVLGETTCAERVAICKAVRCAPISQSCAIRATCVPLQ